MEINDQIRKNHFKKTKENVQISSTFNAGAVGFFDCNFPFTIVEDLDFLVLPTVSQFPDIINEIIN